MPKIVNRELVSVIAVTSLAVMAMSVLQPVTPLYLTSIGVNPAVLGLMFSLSMVGMVFGESSGGWLADRVGVRVPLGIGTFACVPLVLSFVFTRDVPAIFVIFFFWGIVRAAVFGPGRGYIGSTVPLARKATFMAVYAASMSLSRSLGSFIGGLVADALGYDWCFYAAAGIGLLGGAVVVFGLKRIPWNKSAPVHQDPAAVMRPRGGAPYRSRRFLSQCAVGALNFTAIGVVVPFLPLLAVEVSGVDATEVGLLMTTSALVNAALLIPMGRLSDRRNKRAMMAIGLLVTGAGLAGLALAESYTGLIGAVVLQSVGGAMFGPAAVSLLSDTVPSHWQNTAMGVYGACEDIGVVAGAALGGLVWSTVGPPSTFLLVGTTAAVMGSLVTIAFVRRPKINP